MASTVLYPSIPNLQSQMGPDNGILATWATLTPRGTRHFVTYPTKDDHYEIIDFNGKAEQFKKANVTPIKVCMILCSFRWFIGISQNFTELFRK
jgi:hypothetical protein